MGIALALGVFVGARVSRAEAISPMLVVLLTALVLAAVNRGTSRLLLVFLATGCVLGWSALSLRPVDSPTQYAGPASVGFSGTIVSDPQMTASGSLARIRWVDRDGHHRGSFVIWTVGDPAQRGDSVTGQGRIEGVYGDFIQAAWLEIASPAGPLDQGRHDTRAWLSSTLSAHVPGSEGSLALGLLIGDDSGLTREDEDAVREAGLSHITAVSGWNVGLVIGAVGLGFAALGLRGWRWAALQVAALVAFVWIVGFNPPVIRAALMAVAVLTAGRLGRPAHGPTVLALASAIIILSNRGAVSDLSFQLSVLATAGIIAADRLVSLDGWRGAVLKPIAATAAAGILTAPVLAHEFGTTSPLFLPANLMAAPLVAVSTFAAISTIALSWAGPLAAVPGTVTWLFAHGVLNVARVAVSAPFGHLQFVPPGAAATAVVYLVAVVAVALALPEGRFMARRVQRWTNNAPEEALLTVTSASAMAIVGSVAFWGV